MPLLRILVSFASLLLLLGSTSHAGEKVAYEIYAKNYFVKNSAPLPGNPAFLVLHDKKSYDQIFGIGFVIGGKPKLVTESLFQKNLVITAIKSGNALWKYDVEKVTIEKQQLIIAYKATGKESPSAKFTVPLIVSVPRGDYTDIVFIENDKEVSRMPVKK
ncbi:MAG: hypothetical protein EXS16_21065 [Gemmataceae bacterium]|nr:hypothetical protein [Gemmataceae bacterium]